MKRGQLCCVGLRFFRINKRQKKQTKSLKKEKLNKKKTTAYWPRLNIFKTKKQNDEEDGAATGKKSQKGLKKIKELTVLAWTYIFYSEEDRKRMKQQN